jgi:hypothetical protein
VRICPHGDLEIVGNALKKFAFTSSEKELLMIAILEWYFISYFATQPMLGYLSFCTRFSDWVKKIDTNR